MKVVFFGTAEFAVPALKKVSSHVSLVVSQPDRPSGRGLKLRPSPVKQAAIELGLPVSTPESARNSEFIESIAALHPDILLVAAYGQILSLRLLESAKHGGINLHGSILPLYRGAAPIQRSIIEGHTETGVTLMQMAKGMDTGDIIEIRKIPIQPDTKADELTKWLAELAAEMAHVWLPKLCSGEYPRIAQDNELATMAPKILKDEAEIKTSSEAKSAYNLFRGLFPSPGTYFTTASGTVKPTEIKLFLELVDPSIASGTLLKIENQWVLVLQSGGLILTKVKPEGKPEMSFNDYANGARIRSGEKWLVN